MSESDKQKAVQYLLQISERFRDRNHAMTDSQYERHWDVMLHQLINKHCDASTIMKIADDIKRRIDSWDEEFPPQN